MSKIMLILFSFIVFSQNSLGEELRCTPVESSKLKSLWFSKVEHSYAPQWLEGEVNLGLFQGKRRISVKRAPQKTHLTYVGNEVEKRFELKLGEYRGQGLYKNVPLTYSYYNYSHPETLKIQVNCEMIGDFEFKNYCEKTPSNDPQANLIIGSKNQDIDLVKATLHCDVQVDLKGPGGCTPLLLAIDSECSTGVFDPFNSGAYSFDMAEALIQKGADVTERDPKNQESALHKSVIYQDLRTAELLLKSGADVNAKDIDGFTPLMKAVQIAGAHYFIESLVHFGADEKIKNNVGKTAIDIARDLDYEFLIPRILNAEKIVIKGNEFGKCSPEMVHAELGKNLSVSLVNESNKMLMLKSPTLNLMIMVKPNKMAEKTVSAPGAGNYAFECGPHGGPTTQGMIMIK